MITTREQARLRAAILITEPGLRELERDDLLVVSRDELEALDRAYLNLKETQGRCTELLEEARTARREARRWEQLTIAAGEKLVDAHDLAAPEPT